MARRSYTDQEKQEALRLYESDGPSAVTEQLGIPKQTVAHWAKQSGVRTVRTQKTREASEAMAVDAKARRALIAARTLEAAEQATEIIITKLGQVSSGESDDSMRDIATVLGIMADKHKMLVDMDNDSGTVAGKSMLEKLAEQLGAMPVVDPDTEQSSGGSESPAAALPADQ